MPALSSYLDTSVTAKHLSRLTYAGGKLIQPGYDGVVGDGNADDRAAIQTILDNNAGLAIHMKAGNYKVNARPWTGSGHGGALNPPSHTDLLLDPNATIIAGSANNDLEGSAGGQGLINIHLATDVTVKGGIVDGRRATFATGKMHGIASHDSNNVHIEGVYIKNVPGATLAGGPGGDGVLVSGYQDLVVGSTYVTIKDCVMDNCVRQGISVTRGNAILIEGNRMINIAGTDPGAGIDIEPSNSGAACYNINMFSNFIKNCNMGINCSALAQYCNVIGNTINDTRLWGFRFADTQQNVFAHNVVSITANSALNTDGFCQLDRAYWCQIFGNQFLGDASAPLSEFLQLREVFQIQIHGNIWLAIPGPAIKAMATHTLDTEGLDISHNTFYNCSTNARVVEVTPQTHLMKNVSIKDNQFWDTRTGGAEAAHGIYLSATGPEYVTWDIGPNRFQGVAANYGGFPTGFGPGGQVPTADLPAAAAAMDGKDFIEYIDATHRAKVWYRNGKRFKGTSIAES